MSAHLDVPFTSPALPPAVPDYTADLAQAQTTLGRVVLYNAQLRQLLEERAAEANQLHDTLAAALARIAELERQAG